MTHSERTKTWDAAGLIVLLDQAIAALRPEWDGASRSAVAASLLSKNAVVVQAAIERALGGGPYVVVEEIMAEARDLMQAEAAGPAA